MFELTDQGISIGNVVDVSRGGMLIASLSQAVQDRMAATRAWVERALKDNALVIYGVNTGVGPLASVRIANEKARDLSRKLILATVAGVGDPLPTDVVRAMMFIRAAQFARGHSGVRPVLVRTLMDVLNAGITPWVPRKGSLGASGDLAPLAHIAVVLTCGQENCPAEYSGQAWYQGALLSGAEAMERAGIHRLVPEAKEGLALTNGTTFMVAAGALGVHDAFNLLQHAETAAALSMEGLTALSGPLHPILHEVNNQPGQIVTAANLRTLLAGSRLIDSLPHRVQDAYSLRCTPQVIGPVRDALEFIAGHIQRALNSDSDNPLIFTELADIPEGKAMSGGNFHGQGPALWLDFLGIAMAEIGSLSERRTFRLVSPQLNEGLPAMLVPSSGLESGLMMAQYTAAALVSENKTLAHPDSVDSIPSSADQEDHVSMGANAALHTMEILDNLEKIIAIELLTAAQAVSLRPEGPSRLGRGTAIAYHAIREHVAELREDRELTPDILALAELIRSQSIPRRLEQELPGYPMARLK